ncbi:MAG: hypothetical protein JW744_05220 [Candidatus Diapherotrites archaeon]|uniref:Uncharacterized protein n=1 Tax=Candidatus Iainarchaeum sp. TaxID=3101447 RepID=A0A938YTJ4_9ARCH|nr:hypothetical protein [Candidatus Diapherotrites archaeon]
MIKSRRVKRSRSDMPVVVAHPLFSKTFHNTRASRPARKFRGRGPDGGIGARLRKGKRIEIKDI